MLSALLPLVILTTPMLGDPDAEPTAVKTEYWAGHQVVYGTREVPVLGTLQTQLDNYTIARVRRNTDGTVQVDERACKVSFAEVGGLKVYIDADSLPDSRMIFEPVEDTQLYTMTGEVRWDEEDIDGDGNPGMKVYVDAPICSGNLHVSNRTITNSRAFGDEGPFYGEVTVTVRQKILDAEGKCLKAVSEDSFERSKGSFRYAKIKPDDTCTSLLDAGWPVKAK